MIDDRQKSATPAKAARQDRLKQALRENLKRRKAQARERSPGEASPANPPSKKKGAATRDDTGSEQDD